MDTGSSLYRSSWNVKQTRQHPSAFFSQLLSRFMTSNYIVEPAYCWLLTGNNTLLVLVKLPDHQTRILRHAVREKRPRKFRGRMIRSWNFHFPRKGGSAHSLPSHEDGSSTTHGQVGRGAPQGLEFDASDILKVSPFSPRSMTLLYLFSDGKIGDRFWFTRTINRPKSKKRQNF